MLTQRRTRCILRFGEELRAEAPSSMDRCRARSPRGAGGAGRAGTGEAVVCRRDGLLPDDAGDRLEHTVPLRTPRAADDHERAGADLRRDTYGDSAPASSCDTR